LHDTTMSVYFQQCSEEAKKRAAEMVSVPFAG